MAGFSSREGRVRRTRARVLRDRAASRTLLLRRADIAMSTRGERGPGVRHRHRGFRTSKSGDVIMNVRAEGATVLLALASAHSDTWRNRRALYVSDGTRQ